MLSKESHKIINLHKLSVSFYENPEEPQKAEDNLGLNKELKFTTTTIETQQPQK